MYRKTKITDNRLHMSHVTRNPSSEFATRYDTNQPAQLLRLARLEILDIASICIIISKQRATKTLIRLRGCAG